MNPNKKIKNSTDDEMPLAQMNSPNDANNNRSPLQNSPNDANNNRSPLLNSPPIPSQISPASSENRHQFQSQASDEQPFFASNLAYYPELPQPGTAKDMNKYLSYEDWKSAACGNLAVKKTKNLQQQQHQQQQQKHLLKLQKQQNKQQPKQQHQKQQQKQLQKQQKLQQKQKHKEQKELKKLQKSKQSMQHEMANPIGAGHGLQNFNANPYPWQFMEEDNEFSSTSQLFGQPKQQQQEQPRQHEMANPFGAGYEAQKFNANPIPWQVLGNNSYSSTSPQYGQPKQQQQEQPQQEHMLFNENQMMMTQQPFGQPKQQLSQEQTVAAIKANYQNQSLDGNSNIWPFFGDNTCESTHQSYGQPKPKQVEEMVNSINTNYQSQNLVSDSNIWQTLNETHTSPPYGQQKQQMSQDQLNLDGYSNTWNFLNNNNTPQQAYGQPKQQLSQEQIAKAIKANYQNQSLDGNSNIWPFFGDNTCDSTQQSYGQPKQKQVEEMVNSINTNYQSQNLVNDSNIWQTLNANQATSPPSYGQQKQQMSQEQLNLDGSSNTWQFSNNKSSTHKSYRQRKKQLELAQEKTIASVRANFMGQNSNWNSNIWHPLNESGYTSTKLPYGQPKLQQREQLAAGQMAESIKPNNQGQNVGDNPNIFQLLGEKVYASTMQPNGEPLAPLTMLIEMSGVNLACVLSTAHLIENHQDPKDYCMLTHFKDSELRSFVVLSDEVKHVLKRYEIREHNLDNTVPNLASPMADNLPQPPTQWMPNRKLMPKQKELLQNRQTVDARGHDKFINPNLRLVKEWQPRTDTYNYKLQSPSPSPSPSP